MKNFTLKNSNGDFFTAIEIKSRKYAGDLDDPNQVLVGLSTFELADGKKLNRKEDHFEVVQTGEKLYLVD